MLQKDCPVVLRGHSQPIVGSHAPNERTASFSATDLRTAAEDVFVVTLLTPMAASGLTSTVHSSSRESAAPFWPLHACNTHMYM